MPQRSWESQLGAGINLPGPQELGGRSRLATCVSTKGGPHGRWCNTRLRGANKKGVPKGAGAIPGPWVRGGRCRLATCVSNETVSWDTEMWMKGEMRWMTLESWDVEWSDEMLERWDKLIGNWKSEPRKSASIVLKNDSKASFLDFDCDSKNKNSPGSRNLATYSEIVSRVWIGCWAAVTAFAPEWLIKERTKLRPMLLLSKKRDTNLKMSAWNVGLNYGFKCWLNSVWNVGFDCWKILAIIFVWNIGLNVGLKCWKIWAIDVGEYLCCWFDYEPVAAEIIQCC